MATIPSPERRFSCEVEPDRDSVRVVPVGELDVDTAAAVEEHLREVLDSGFSEVVLDLRRLTFMDSTGLHLIFKADARAERDGTSFVVIPGPRAIQRLFDLTGTRGHLTFGEPGLGNGARRE